MLVLSAPEPHMSVSEVLFLEVDTHPITLFRRASANKTIGAYSYFISEYGLGLDNVKNYQVWLKLCPQVHETFTNVFGRLFSLTDVLLTPMKRSTPTCTGH